MPRRLIRPLLALGFGLFGLAAVIPVYNTYVPILLHQAGLSAAGVGFVMTWDNWLNIFIPLWAGRESDRRWTRIGRRKPWILAGALLALSIIFLPFAGALPALLLALFLTSLGLAIARSPGLTLLGDLFPASMRSTASGVINVFGGVGAIVALVGGRFLFALHPAAPFLLTGALLLVGVVILLLGIRERPETQVETPRADMALWPQFLALTRGDRSGLYLLLAVFFAYSGFTAAETWLSSFAHFALGVPRAQLPLFMAVFAATMLLGAIPSGAVAKRWGRKRLTVGGMAALAALLAAGAAVQSPWLLAALLALAGAAWSPILVNLLPLFYDVGGEQSLGALTGFYYVASSLAAVAGPQLVGVVIDVSGGYGAVWAIAAALVALGAWILTRVR